ncbi:FAP-57 protein [Pseudoscourfieldia marina]
MAHAGDRTSYPDTGALLSPLFALGVNSHVHKALLHVDDTSVLYPVGAHFALLNTASSESTVHELDKARRWRVTSVTPDPNKKLLASLERRAGATKPSRVAVYSLAKLLKNAAVPESAGGAFNAVPRVATFKFPVADHVKSTEVVAASFSGDSSTLIVMSGEPDFLITFWNPKDSLKPTLVVKNPDNTAFAMCSSLSTEEDALYDFATISDNFVRGWRRSERQTEVCRSSVLAPKLTTVRPFRAATYLLSGQLAVTCGGSDTEENVPPFVLIFKGQNLAAKVRLPNETGELLVPNHISYSVDGFVVAGVGTKVLCFEYHGGESGDEGENAGTNKSKAGDGDANDDGGLDAAAYSGYGWNIGRSIDVPVDAMVAASNSDKDAPSSKRTAAAAAAAASTGAGGGNGAAGAAGADFLTQSDSFNEAQRDPNFVAGAAVRVSGISINGGGTSLVLVRNDSQLMAASLPADPLQRPKFAEAFGGFHEGAVNSVSICRNLPFFSTAGRDGAVRIWNYQLKRAILTKRFPEELHCTSMHPDGNLVLVAGRKVTLLELMGNDLLVRNEIQYQNVRAVAFSNHGHLFAIARQSVIQIYSTTECLLPRGQVEALHVLKGHFNQVYSLKWRADDLALYSGDKGGAVYEWNVAFGQRIIDHDYVSKSLEISSHGSLDVITCEPYEDSNYLSHARLADHKKKEDQEEAEAGGYGYESAPAAAPVALPPRHPVCLTVINNADSTLRFLKDGNGDFKMSISASFKKVSQRALNLVGVDMNGGKEEGFERGGSHYVQDKDFTQARCINLLGNGRVCLTASTTGSLISVPWVGNGDIALASKVQSTAHNHRREMQLHISGVTCSAVSADQDIYVSCDEHGQIFVSSLSVLLYGSVLPSPIRKGLVGAVPKVMDCMDWAMVPTVVHMLKEDIEETAREIVDRTAAIDDLKSEIEFKELINAQAQKDLAAKYEETLDEVRSKYEEKLRLTNEDHNMRDFEATGAMRALEGAHLTAAEELETLYERKLAIEVARYQALKIETDERITSLKDEITTIVRDNQAREAEVESRHVEQVRQIVEEMANQRTKFEDDAQEMQDLLTVTDEVDEEDFDAFHHQKHVEVKNAIMRIQNLRAEMSVARRNVERARKGESEADKKHEKVVKANKSLQEEIEGHKKRIMELQSELQARENVIGQKEQSILMLKRKNDTLEKHRVVLDHWQAEMREQVAPREEELARLKKAAQEMDSDFMKEAERNEMLERVLDREKTANRSLRKELSEIRMKKSDCERSLSNYSNELARALTAPAGHSKDAVLREIAIKVEKTLNRFRDNSDLDPEFIADKDRSESELLRQRNMLEGLNSALEARVDRAERRRVKSNGDMMRQNEALLEDNAELRKENKTLGDKLNKLETRIFQLEGSKRSSAKGGPSSSTPSTPAADRGSSAGSKHPLYESRGAFRASKAIRSPPVSRSESASRPSTAAGGGFQPALKGSLRTGGTSRALNEIVQWERERIEELLGRLELSHREIERRDQELASLRAAHGVADPPSHAEYPPSPAPPYSSARPSTAPVAQHGTQTAPSAIPTAVPSPVHAPSIGGWRGGSARPARFSAPRASSRPSTGR